MLNGKSGTIAKKLKNMITLPCKTGKITDSYEK